MIIDAKFVTTTSAKLSTIAVEDGQVIALSDKDAWYYDMGGSRHAVTGNKIDNVLPSSGDADTLYALNSDDPEVSGVYIWAGTQFVKICGLDNEKVKTETSENTKVYLVGSVSAINSTEALVKNTGVFIDLVTKKSSIIASSAASADAAVNDSEGNAINETYIKGVTAQKTGSTVIFTITKGDNSTSTFTVEVSDTTYDIFKGASETEAGKAGLVPAPTTDDVAKFLCSDGTWKEVEATDTKNTVGSTNNEVKLYVVGTTGQHESEQSYTNKKVYINNAGHLYSHTKQVVNVNDPQALENKTYEGYTLGNIVEKDLAADIEAGNNDIPTSDLVYQKVEEILQSAKDYTDSAIGGVTHFGIEVVASLPTSNIKTNTIYLVPNGESTGQNVKTEYMYINGQWEIIGSTDIDLSDYPTTSEMNTAISDAISQADTGLSVVDGQLCITYQQ